MNFESKPSSYFAVGGDIIDILTTGMYLNPLDVLREFIQNSADSFEKLPPQDRQRARVDVQLDAPNREVTVLDNGPSVASKHAQKKLLSLGFSEKKGQSARGFRGIGRLAALGYCEELWFEFFDGLDPQPTRIVFSRERLREWMKAHRDTNDIYDAITFIARLETVSKPKGAKHKSYFKVSMKGVDKVGPKDAFFDIPQVSAYLAQVAPAPFHPEFKFKDAIERELETYFDLLDIPVYLNNSAQPLYKPYGDSLLYQKGVIGSLEDVRSYFVDDEDGNAIAYLWVGVHSFNGTIMPNSLQGRIRVRQGNIQIGEATFLDSWFSETRFNGWNVGELHILSNGFIPNARRDAFLITPESAYLRDNIQPIIDELSSQCRASSSARSKERRIENIENATNDIAPQNSDVMLPTSPRENTNTEQMSVQDDGFDLRSADVLSVLMEELQPAEARKIFRKILAS